MGSGGGFCGEGTADSSFSPAPADGSPVPSDGSQVLPDGFVQYCDCLYCFCCEETVVLKFVDHDIAKPERQIEKIDKTHRIPDPSVAVKCGSFPIADTCSTNIEQLQGLFGFELSSFPEIAYSKRQICHRHLHVTVAYRL